MVNGHGPWHVSAGTWAWVRSMYGIAMNQTGAELAVELHLQIATGRSRSGTRS